MPQGTKIELHAHKLYGQSAHGPIMQWPRQQNRLLPGHFLYRRAATAAGGVTPWRLLGANSPESIRCRFSILAALGTLEPLGRTPQ